jgi:hypothetical protein
MWLVCNALQVHPAANPQQQQQQPHHEPVPVKQPPVRALQQVPRLLPWRQPQPCSAATARSFNLYCRSSYSGTRWVMMLCAAAEDDGDMHWWFSCSIQPHMAVMAPVVSCAPLLHATQACTV